MFFSNTPRYPVFSTTAVATLAHLREETFPQLIEPPQFIPVRKPRATLPPWLVRLLRPFRNPLIVAAAIAAVVLTVTAALPAWAAFQSGPAGAGPVVRSSVGGTGTAATRVEDLGAATFLGRLTFVQQVRYLGALTGASPSEAERFLTGAREASLAQYLYDVTAQIALPYLSDTVATKTAVEAWVAATASQQGRLYRASYGAPAIAPGTRIANAHVTFYSCIDNGFCGLMANGEQVFAGAAACSTDLPFGTRFVITNDASGRTFVCLDRGLLPPPWVDVWFYDAADGWAWQAGTGTVSDILIVE